MLVSVIFPVYNEQENLNPLFDQLTSALNGDPTTNYEVIFVDDCSNDNSFAILQELSRRKSRFPVRVIRLSRNSGSHLALLAGIKYCRGDAALDMAADLQCPLEAIPALVAKHREGFPIVWGQRVKRQDPLITVFFSKIYYRLLKILVKQDFPFSDIETCLFDRKIINQLKAIREKNTNLFLLISTLGFLQGSVVVERRERQAGRSGWTLGRRIKLMLDSLLAFSYLPIRFISGIGILISIAGFILAGQQIYDKLTGVPKPLGWTFLVVLILILSGIQMLMLGLLGEYLWRVVDQTSTKPFLVIDSLIGFDDQTEKSEFTDSQRKELP